VQNSISAFTPTSEVVMQSSMLNILDRKFHDDGATGISDSLRAVSCV